jgi:aspartate-semialdehyde dehydrogenase
MLGGELIARLADTTISVSELVPWATDRSLGCDVEFRGETIAVETQAPALRGFDLLFLCAPASASAELVREALRAEVPCIDAGGALAGTREVPLRVAAFGEGGAQERWPLAVAPPGAALALALVLRPLAQAAGLARVVGTLLESASAGGREGARALFQESLSLFNQNELPPPEVFACPVAFDCLGAQGAGEENGASFHEVRLAEVLARLLPSPPRLALACVQVPVFAGVAASLALETEQPLDPKQAFEALAAAPDVEPWEVDAGVLTLRAAAGGASVRVARPRRDPTVASGLLLWLAADALQLAAANAVRLAVTRLGAHH